MKHCRDPRLVHAFTAIDIHNPRFCDILGEFLNKHIPALNRQGSRWKRAYKDTDREYYFIADTGFTAPRLYNRLKHVFVRWILNTMFGVDVEDHNWYWRETIKRHFRCTDAELDQMQGTMQALSHSGLSRDQIKTNTDLILKDSETEY